MFAENPDGSPAESLDETFWRVAYHVAKVEETWGNDSILERAEQFYELLTTKAVFPKLPDIYRCWYSLRTIGGLFCITVK